MPAPVCSVGLHTEYWEHRKLEAKQNDKELALGKPPWKNNLNRVITQNKVSGKKCAQI